MSKIAKALIIAGGMLVISVLIVVAKKSGMIDGDTSTRGLMALTGLVLAYFANEGPKAVFRTARQLNVQRVSGWTFVLASIAYAGIWTFAPMDFALPLSMIAMFTAGVVTFGYCLFTRGTPARG